MENLEYYEVLLPIALILITAKLLMKLCKKLNLPEVIGMLIAGILVGLINYIPGQNILNETTHIGLEFFSKIGVILIMFIAGLETDLNAIKKVGGPSLLVTVAGVIIPLILGFFVAAGFNGGFEAMSDKAIILENLFYGVILTATSVSVSIAVLKESGRLNSKAGATIMAAALVDDILGMIVLSFILAMGGASATSPWLVLIKTVLYFVAIIIVTFIARKLFDYISHRWPRHRIVAIFSLAFCFIVSYCSEKFFGIADITGAYLVGVILSTNKQNEYINRRTCQLSYLLFEPIFFGSIGLSMSFDGISSKIALFGISFVVIGLLGKVIGCSLAAKCCKYTNSESLAVGIGMMARAEVALISAQKGIDAGIIQPSIMPFIVILIIVSSLLTPLLLQIIFKHEDKKKASDIEAN